MYKIELIILLLFIIEVLGSAVGNNSVCTLVENSNAQGDLIVTEMDITLEECCESCSIHPECNVFVYCPKQEGCINAGNNQVFDYQRCDLKFQERVGQGQEALYWYRGPSTGFSSGYILNQQKGWQQLNDGGSQRRTQHATMALNHIPQEEVLGSEVGNNSVCTLVENSNAQGDLIVTEMEIILEECCESCSIHPECNVFVYCPKQEGCINAGNNQVFDYQRCDLKFQERVGEGQEALYWYRGPSTDFSSGYILNKQKGDTVPAPQSPQPLSSPLPAPTTPPLLENLDEDKDKDTPLLEVIPLVTRVNFGACFVQSGCGWWKRGMRYIYDQRKNSCQAYWDCKHNGFDTQDQCNTCVQ